MPRSSYTPQDKKNMMKISDNLKSLASKRGASQTSISDSLGIPISTLNGYFKGTSLPTPGNVEKLSQYFNVSKSEIDPRFEMSTVNEEPSSYEIENSKVKLLAAHIDDDATEEEIQDILDYIEFKKKNRK